MNRKRIGATFSLGLLVCLVRAHGDEFRGYYPENPRAKPQDDSSLNLVGTPEQEIQRSNLTVARPRTFGAVEPGARISGKRAIPRTITDASDGDPGNGSPRGEFGSDRRQRESESQRASPPPDASLAAPARPGSVVLSFPSPGTSPQDLAWDGTHLWLVDDKTEKIYKLNPADGTVLASFAAPGSRARGLAWDGAHVWAVDDGTKKAHQLDPNSARTLVSVNIPIQTATCRRSELGGLAWDGEHLWSGRIAGWSSRMNQLNLNDGSVSRFYFTKGVPRALASNGKFLWSATDNGGRRPGIVYKYRLSDGHCVSHFDTPGYYPTGLAFDSAHLWCVDHATRTIYKLSVD